MIHAKEILLVALLVLVAHLGRGQDIVALENKLRFEKLSVQDSIETLNLLSRELTFVNPFQALEYANKALHLSTQLNYSTGIAYAYRNLSNIYSYNESYFISMEYLQRALDIFTAHQDSMGIANCYISLGHTYRRLQNREEEVDYHLKSYQIFKRLSVWERIGVTAHNLGESYYNSGDLAQSRSLTRYAIKINDSLHNEPVLSACYKVMGLIELSENRLLEAEGYFKEVLNLTAKLGEQSQKVAAAESMIQLARLNEMNGNRPNQLKFLLMALEFSRTHNLSSYLQRAYQELILYSSAQNDQKAVRDYINANRIVSDSLMQRQLRDRYHLTKTIVQVHELSKSKIALEKTSWAQEQQIQTRNTILLIIAISIVVLVILLIKYMQLTKQLKHQNLTIELQKKDLERLNDTKDKFFSIVAHDLKSPLTSLQSFSSLLTNHFDKLSKEEIQTMSRELYQSVGNTIRMADSLITWAKVQMHDYQTSETIIKVGDLVTNLCNVYKNVAEEKNIMVSCSVDDTLSIKGDSNQVEFIIRNLVNNAIKFTPAGGKVNLSASLQPSGLVHISVSDNGIGIPEEIKSKLFTVGNKKSRKGTAGEKGTGLGLILSYEFIKLNGGDIFVDSNIGKGSTFHAVFQNGGA
jgi:signal transduction histidine kinase